MLYMYIGVETIVENLSHQLENSSPSEASAKPVDPTAARLAALRKQVLLQMTSQLHKVEEAGGMRNICFFQVIWKSVYVPNKYVSLCEIMQGSFGRQLDHKKCTCIYCTPKCSY